MRFHYVLPVHNEEAHLANTVDSLTQYLTSYPHSSILLCENGSIDASWEVCLKLSQKSTSQLQIIPLKTSSAGIGHGYALGLEYLLKTDQIKNEDWIILSAADLPFRFSDIESLLSFKEKDRHPLYIGSKAHKDSVIQINFKRKVSSFFYYFLRKLILGMKTKDSQGVIIGRKSVFSKLFPKIKSRNFFFSTELVYYSEKQGVNPIELPVKYIETERTSRVKVFKHGMQMIKEMLSISR